MALDFPSSPTNNQVYENYIYNSTSGAWQKLPGNTFATTAISDTPPVNPANGDLWWSSADGKFYIYYSDGSSAQWVSAALPAVAVSDTPPAGYDGQMWLDSTDGSMYVYYTDPGGASSSWIGAVSRSGGILQVVSAETATQTNTPSTSFVNTAASVTITPSSTSSKILVFGYAGLFQTGGNTGAKLTLARDTTSIGEESTLYTGASAIVPAHLQALDGPATTSSVTYRLRLRTQNASFAAAAAFHVMTAIEVAG